MPKIKIYLDNGANIKWIKHLPFCHFVNVPYDEDGRRTQLAKISDAEWEHLDLKWNELPEDEKQEGFTFLNLEGSSVFDAIIEIVGDEKDFRKDVLHLDSAVKEKVDIFFTNDKNHICKHKELLEPICGFKIFHSPSELCEMMEYIEKLQLLTQ